MTAGDEVFQADDADQPCGTVAQAAPSPAGGFDAIISAQVSAVDAGNLHLTSAAGAAVAVSPPPYPLLADI
jgi:hypothetical protein